MGPFYFCLQVFLGINRHPKQKEFLNSCEGFLRAALTGHSHPSPFCKIAKMALFNPCMKLEIFFWPNVYIWSAKKLSFRNFIQNISQAPSKCLSKWIKVDKWDYLKNPSHELKNSFCLGFLWIPRQTGRQNWRGPIF
jgi:hypothetical protein